MYIIDRSEKGHVGHLRQMETADRWTGIISFLTKGHLSQSEPGLLYLAKFRLLLNPFVKKTTSYESHSSGENLN